MKALTSKGNLAVIQTSCAAYASSFLMPLTGLTAPKLNDTALVENTKPTCGISEITTASTPTASAGAIALTHCTAIWSNATCNERMSCWPPAEREGALP